MAAYAPLTRDQIAARIARDIEDGWYVNLGIGMPTLVGNYLPPDRDIVIHSENGILGMGPTPGPNALDPWLVNAGKQPVTLVKGAALFHHADSFTMIRGRHLDLCVLGAYQVAENGDIANWTTPAGERVPAIGGAMDLAVGAKRVWVFMEHTTKDGQAKLVDRCTYPLTAAGSVTRVYTNLAVLDVTMRGFSMIDRVPGLGLDELRALTGASIHVPACSG
jgi:3-oxoadipate CoA-transferase beta subunit